MAEKIDKIEKSKRIRSVMEWILEDWPHADILSNIMTKWSVKERQAKRYIAHARAEWNKDEQSILEQRRRMKVESLRKLKRSLKDQYKGTPFGIRSILAVEKEIIQLEGLRPADRLKILGYDDGPVKTETTVKSNVDYTMLTDDILLAIAKAKIKSNE